MKKLTEMLAKKWAGNETERAYESFWTLFLNSCAVLATIMWSILPPPIGIDLVHMIIVGLMVLVAIPMAVMSWFRKTRQLFMMPLDRFLISRQ